MFDPISSSLNNHTKLNNWQITAKCSPFCKATKAYLMQDLCNWINEVCNATALNHSCLNNTILYSQRNKRRKQSTRRSDVCGVLMVKYPSRSTNWMALLPYRGRSGQTLHMSSSNASLWLAGELLHNSRPLYEDGPSQCIYAERDNS